MDAREKSSSGKRLIDANALKERAIRMVTVNSLGNKQHCYFKAVGTDEIDKAPTVDAVPARHGRWINAYPDIEPNPMFMYGICSECGFKQGFSKYLNYCPNCGAKMDVDTELKEGVNR